MANSPSALRVRESAVANLRSNVVRNDTDIQILGKASMMRALRSGVDVEPDEVGWNPVDETGMSVVSWLGEFVQENSDRVWYRCRVCPRVLLARVGQRQEP